ncbi:MAG: twin-arginine translocase TatA/TatE family subunit [Lentisphaerae bacterium]|nr:twin-arginine translocase TatA/TatE family subunit [Lentisphaerota bacterium]
MSVPLAFFGSSMGAGEILLILVVILLLFGAERLPAMARSLGKALEEFRRSARDLTRDVMDSHPAKPARPPVAQPLPARNAAHSAAGGLARSDCGLGSVAGGPSPDAPPPSAPSAIVDPPSGNAKANSTTGQAG